MRWYQRLFRRAQTERQLDTELRFHLEQQIAHYIATGMTQEEARRCARLEFGGLEQVKEECRDVGAARFVDTLIQDVRYGLRQLRRNPGFTAVAIITLALGIGATTAIFSVVNAVLLRSLPYRDPSRVVLITGGATPVRYEEIRAAARSYLAVGAFPGAAVENVTISGQGAPEALKGARVSANSLQILGVSPLLGHGFLPQDDNPGGRQVVMISDALWRHRFGSDPRIVGKTASLNLQPYTIVGVLPAGFAFPFSGADIWFPRPSDWSMIPPSHRRISPILHVFGRLKPGVSLKQASSEMAVLNRQYAIAHPTMLDAKRHSTAKVTSLKDQLVSNVRPMLWMLFGAVGFVLLIACGNVAGLLTARAAFRSAEFAVRAALGAGRGRLIRQLLVESLLLAFGGGALGTVLAELAVSGIAKMSLPGLPPATEVRLDSVVLGFTAAVCIFTGVVSGLLPSLWASRRDLMEALHGRGVNGAFGFRRRHAFGLTTRGLLVTGQVALSVILLIGAVLLVLSLAHLEDVNPGFQPAHLLTMRIAIPITKYRTSQKRAAFLSEIVQSIDSVPGIRGAAVTFTLPMTGFAMSPIAIAEQPPVKFNKRPFGIIQSVTPGYFRTLSIPLERGREFTRDDVQGSVPVVVISENLARHFWPDYPNSENPVGKHLLVGATDGARAPEIIGVVADVHQAGLEAAAKPELYFPYAQSPLPSAMLAIRTTGNPSQFVNTVRKRIQAIDPDEAVSDVRSMAEVVQESLGQPKLMTLLIGLFAALALVLALIGIYGVISYSAAQRTHEMGIRAALGAGRRDILRLVLGQGIRLALVGVVIGEAGAYGLTRVIRSLLFHVSATDPATFAAAAVMFVIVALTACYIPARRAAKVNPVVALRHE